MKIKLYETKDFYQFKINLPSHNTQQSKISIAINLPQLTSRCNVQN